MNMNSQNRLRQRTYAVDHHVRYGHRFRAMVRHPALASDRKPRVRWQAFHEVEPAPGMGAFPAPPAPSARQSAALSLAPESHANLRALASMPRSALSAYGASGVYDGVDYSALNDSTVLPMDLQRYAAAVGGDASQITGGSPTAARAAASARSGELPDVPAFSGGVGGFGAAGSGLAAAGGSLFPEIARFAAETTEAGEASLPHAAALHPALPDPDDYADTGAGAEGLSRYAARVFSGTGGVPLRGVTLVPQQRPALAGRDATPLGAGSRGRLSDAAARGGEACGPLAGFHAISRTVSHAAGLGEEEAGDEEAGPMHFAAGPSYERGGALRNLKSLFAEDLEKAAAEAAAEAEAAGGAGAGGAAGVSGVSGTPGGGAPGGTPGGAPRGGDLA
jgi:hypothetical protein